MKSCPESQKKEPKNKQTATATKKQKQSDSVCIIKIYFSKINKSLAHYIPRKCNGSLIRTPKINRNSQVAIEVFYPQPLYKDTFRSKTSFPTSLRCLKNITKTFWRSQLHVEIISCILVQNGQTCFNNLALFTPQDFKSMCGHYAWKT